MVKQAKPCHRLTIIVCPERVGLFLGSPKRQSVYREIQASREKYCYSSLFVRLIAMDQTEKRPVLFPASDRKSCIFMLIKLWLGIGAVIVLVMVLVKSSAVTEPEKVEAHLKEWVNFEKPEGFEPYRKNAFWGVSSISFWDMRNLHEDGRTKAYVAFIKDKRWKKKPVDVWLPARLKQMEEGFDQTEFKVRGQSEELLGTGPLEKIYIFSGLQRIDADMIEALTCLRFVDGPAGFIQIQTQGLESVFPLEDQLAILKGVKPIPK